MDAIELLESQHREVEKLFSRAEKASGAEQRRIFQEIADQLTVHAAIEEQHFYPAAYESKTSEQLHEAVEEHLSVKRLISDLLQEGLEEERIEAGIKVLKEQVMHHVEEEESELFPKTRRILGKQGLMDLGTIMELAAKDLLEQGAPREQVHAETGEPAPLP